MISSYKYTNYGITNYIKDNNSSKLEIFYKEQL